MFKIADPVTGLDLSPIIIQRILIVFGVDVCFDYVVYVKFAAFPDILVKFSRRHVVYVVAPWLVIFQIEKCFFLIAVFYRHFVDFGHIPNGIFHVPSIVFGHAGHHIDCTAVFGTVVDEGAAFNIDAVSLVGILVNHAGNRAAEAA